MKKIILLLSFGVLLTSSCTKDTFEANGDIGDVAIKENLFQEWGSSISQVKDVMRSYIILSEEERSLLYEGTHGTKILFGFDNGGLSSSSILSNIKSPIVGIDLSPYEYLGMVNESEVYLSDNNLALIFETSVGDEVYKVFGTTSISQGSLPEYKPIKIVHTDVNTGYNATSVGFELSGISSSAKVIIEYSTKIDFSDSKTKAVTVSDNGLGVIELTSLKFNTEYFAYIRATTNNITYTGDFFNFKTQDAKEGMSNGYRWVNLGLPSGNLWASIDIGAKSDGEAGSYFSWGASYSALPTCWNDYQYFEGVFYGNTQLKNIGREISGTNYDTAKRFWGSPWRMPKLIDCQELAQYCKAESNSTNIKVIGPNGNFIYFARTGQYIRDYSSDCNYSWSSTETSNIHASYLTVSNEGVCVTSNDNYSRPIGIKWYGLTVRPIIYPDDL